MWKEEFPAFMAGLSHDPGEPQTVALEILHGRQQLGALRATVGTHHGETGPTTFLPSPKVSIGERVASKPELTMEHFWGIPEGSRRKEMSVGRARARGLRSWGGVARYTHRVNR